MPDDDLDLPWPADEEETPTVQEAVAATTVPSPPISFEGEDIDPVTGLVVTQDTVEDANEILFPWMRYHEFVLVRSASELEEVIDKALAHGSCGLDLETEGFDNRINYDAEGKPHTVHQIVGVCLSVKGTGYYTPVRHAFNPIYDEPDPNVAPHLVEKALTRLCQAAQPVLTPEGLADDPLGSAKIAEKGKVVISFWNAKFDQEFLYPITGVDYWHPSSFEDGLLIRYCIYTDDTLKLKDQAKRNLKIKDPKTGDEYPYEMIRFGDLFKKEIKKANRKIQNLHPLLDPNVTRYGCSDAICTELLVQQTLPEISKLKVDFTYLVEKHTVQVVRQMERTRTKIDRSAVAAVLEEAEKELILLDTQIKELAASKGMHNFNPASPAQLSDFLFGPSGLDIQPKPPKTGDGTGDQFKTDADTLEAMLEENPDAPPVLRWILHYRQIQRIIGTYLNRFLADCDEHDQLRFNFNQTGAATGRFTAPAGEPDHGFFGGPIQGIPARDDPKKPKVAHSLRRVFVARTGYTLVKADYAGQELRLVANVSGEPLWINEFLHGTGDLHSLTARAFFNLPVGEPVPKHLRTAGKCVHPSTLVYVDDLLTPLGSLPLPEEPETFRDVKGTTQDGSGPKHITATFNGGVKPLVHVVTTGGILTCTTEHRLKTRRGEFVRAGDLQEGDQLLEVKTPQVKDTFYPELSLSLWDGIPLSKYTLDHHLAYFAGVYAGDGTGNTSSAAITHGDPEKMDAYGNPYEEWVRSLEAASTACGFTTSRKDFDSLYLGSRVFVRYLEALGLHRKRSKHLRIPPWVLAAGKTAILHYFGGILDTDGTVGAESHALDWTTKDFVFAGQVAAALRACGLDFNVELTFNKTYERYYVRQRLTVESSWRMREYMKHAGKLSRLREPRQAGQVRDRFVVSKVLPAGDLPCVDISVETSHAYIANGLVTHNTANFALVYGGGVQAVRRATGVDKHEAARQKSAFDKSVPIFTRWLKGQHEAVKRNLGIHTAFGRWIAIPDANIKPGGKFETSNGKFMDVDVPLARKIQASCERKSVNYPIQGAGADVMKISLVRLCREFYKKGWLKMGGDDSVRMLMTIHDEIVFEIRHDRLEEAIPLLCEVMESPTKKLPKWKVPLIVEPLIGLDWSAKYDWEKIKKGEKPVPEWLDGYVKPGETIHNKETEPKAQVSPHVAPSTPVTLPAPSNGAGVNASAKLQDIAVFSISTILLTQHSVRIIKAACILAEDENGKVLRLTDDEGNVLIEPTLGIRVNPNTFGHELRSRNLGHGDFEVTNL